MIGLILIFFVGKAFYELALQNNKSVWLYAVLGVAAYYAGTFVGDILTLINIGGTQESCYTIENRYPMSAPPITTQAVFRPLK